MGPCSLTGRPRRLRAIPASRRSIWASRSMPELLTIERLSAGYGEAVVLNAISLTLAEGQSLALLGRNGMAKTTLINSIVGVTRFISGRIGLRSEEHTSELQSQSNLVCRLLLEKKKKKLLRTYP